MFGFCRGDEDDDLHRSSRGGQHFSNTELLRTPYDSNAKSYSRSVNSLNTSGEMLVNTYGMQGSFEENGFGMLFSSPSQHARSNSGFNLDHIDMVDTSELLLDTSFLEIIAATLDKYFKCLSHINLDQASEELKNALTPDVKQYQLWKELVDVLENLIKLERSYHSMTYCKTSYRHDTSKQRLSTSYVYIQSAFDRILTQISRGISYASMGNNSDAILEGGNRDLSRSKSSSLEKSDALCYIIDTLKEAIHFASLRANIADIYLNLTSASNSKSINDTADSSIIRKESESSAKSMYNTKSRTNTMNSVLSDFENYGYMTENNDNLAMGTRSGESIFSFANLNDHVSDVECYSSKNNYIVDTPDEEYQEANQSKDQDDSAYFSIAGMNYKKLRVHTQSILETYASSRESIVKSLFDCAILELKLLSLIFEIQAAISCYFLAKTVFLLHFCKSQLSSWGQHIDSLCKNRSSEQTKEENLTSTDPKLPSPFLLSDKTIGDNSPSKDKPSPLVETDNSSAVNVAATFPCFRWIRRFYLALISKTILFFDRSLNKSYNLLSKHVISSYDYVAAIHKFVERVEQRKKSLWVAIMLDRELCCDVRDYYGVPQGATTGYSYRLPTKKEADKLHLQLDSPTQNEPQHYERADEQVDGLARWLADTLFSWPSEIERRHLPTIVSLLRDSAVTLNEYPTQPLTYMEPKLSTTYYVAKIDTAVSFVALCVDKQNRKQQMSDDKSISDFVANITHAIRNNLLFNKLKK